MKVFYKQVQLNPTTETDYTDLVNKPSINGVELEGDLSTEQIKVTWHGTQEEFDALPSHDPYTFYIIDDGTPVGTQDSYLDLADKPSINGQILTGNKVSSDLNMYTSDEVDNIIASMRAIKVVTALPAAPQVNTMYYVGPDSEGVYMVYLYDSLLNRIDLGPSVQKLYTAGNAIGINETTSTISVKYDDDTIKTNTNNELYVKKLDTTLTKGANTTDAVKAVWVENGDVKEHTVDSGTNTRPVYIDDGVIKPVNQVASGAYRDAVPFINNDGVADIGKFIDYHDPTSTKDYDLRLGFVDTANTSKLRVAGGDAPGYIPVTGNATSVGSKVQPIYVDNGIIVAGVSQYMAAPGSTPITANSDLNSLPYTIPGAYHCSGYSTTSSLTNKPVDLGSAFRMNVYFLNGVSDTTADSSGSNRTREIIDLFGNHWYQNVSYNNSTSTVDYGN